MLIGIGVETSIKNNFDRHETTGIINCRNTKIA